MHRFIKAIFVILLAVFLTACGAATIPAREIVEEAIALQVSQTQAVLEQQLYRTAAPATDFSVSGVKVDERRSLTIQDRKGYHLQGTYDITLNFPERQVTKRKNPFEIYLQQQGTDKTWNLAKPQLTDSTVETWEIQPIVIESQEAQPSS